MGALLKKTAELSLGLDAQVKLKDALNGLQVRKQQREKWMELNKFPGVRIDKRDALMFLVYFDYLGAL